MAETGFEAKRGEVLAVPTGGQLGAKAAVLVGMGEPDDDRRRRAAPCRRRARAARRRRSTKVATTLLDAAPDSLDRADAAQAFAEGVALGALPVPRVQVGGQAVAARVACRCSGEANAKVRDGLDRGARIAEAVAWARDLVNEPAEAKSPETRREARTRARARERPEGAGAGAASSSCASGSAA